MSACRLAWRQRPSITAERRFINSRMRDVHTGLRLEYRRTARRTRALEDVLLPEIDETLRVIAASLEESEREEAIRVRQIHRAG